MICTSISNCNYSRANKILAGRKTQMAELRMDLCPLLDIDDIEFLCMGSPVPLIATHRLPANNDTANSLNKYEAAITCGARFMDLDIDAPTHIARYLTAVCGSHCRIIRSFHDYEGCPDIHTLQNVIQRCIDGKADIIKIAVTASGDWRETLRSLYLNNTHLKGRLIAFAMGADGMESRLECLKEGAPFTYCYPDGMTSTAPGQMSSKEMLAKTGGSHYRILNIKRPAASKSHAERAIMAAALASGTSTISGYTPCQDSENAITVAVQLGAKVERNAGKLTIEGIGATPYSVDINRIDAGESGLLTRMTAPTAAVLSRIPFTITGSGTLMKRDMTPLVEGLRELGMEVKTVKDKVPETGQEERKLTLPLEISGKATGGNLTINAGTGSQTTTGLLYSLPLLNKNSTMKVLNPKSRPYLAMTENVLDEFGIKTDRQEIDKDIIYSIAGGQQYRSARIKLEADWSGIAGYLVYAAISGRVSIHSMSDSSLQADCRIMDILKDAGATILNGFTTGGSLLTVSAGPLRAFNADLTDSPDLFPTVSVLAAFCTGESRIQGVSRLHEKESDRAKAIQSMLSQMGTGVEIKGDCMTIIGESLYCRLLNGTMPEPGIYNTSGDHRMTMAILILKALTKGKVEPEETKSIEKSYPDFETPLIDKRIKGKME